MNICTMCNREARGVVEADVVFVRVGPGTAQETRGVPGHVCRQCADHCQMRAFILAGGATAEATP